MKPIGLVRVVQRGSLTANTPKSPIQVGVRQRFDYGGQGSEGDKQHGKTSRLMTAGVTAVGAAVLAYRFYTEKRTAKCQDLTNKSVYATKMRDIGEQKAVHKQFPLAWTELSDEENQRIKAAFTDWPFTDMIRYPGDVVLPRTFIPIAERIYNFEVKPDDIWIVTYPKCGTTWTQEMVWQIVNDVDKEKGKIPLLARSPFLEFGCIAPPPKEGAGGESVIDRSVTKNLAKAPESMQEGMEAMMRHMADPIEYTRTLSGRRVIKCHLPMEFLPPGIVDKCKVVYVARNPKDAAVSFYYHCLLLHGYVGDFEEFLLQFEDDLMFYGSYWHHILGGWEYKDHKNFTFLWFEDMKKDLKSVIQDLCQFLDHDLAEDKVNQLVEDLKFENIKKNPAVNHEDLTKEKEGKFMRKGIVGDWKNHFDEKRNQKWNKWVDQNTQGKNLTVPGNK